MSENRNGALAFKATLDIDDFNVSAEAMERRIRNASTNIGYEAQSMENSILNFARNGAKYIVTYLVAGGMTRLANSIVQTRGQFQQLEIAFETMLGNASRSKALMDQMIDTAAKTPFDLKGVAGGAKQLLAYGFAAEEVNDTLIRLGNIASGLSVPLNDMVYLYGTTMTQGRLYAQDMRQFMGRGIPLARELGEMYGKTTDEINEMVSAGKIGFSDVEKVIYKMTDAGGQFFNLMHKQSSSLTGMIANLEDAWDMAINDLGEQHQDFFAKGIEGATYMVEHLDDIIRILKAIAIAYGTYKAAIVANTLATKGNTGVALIDNTVKQIKLSLMREEARLKGQTIAKTAELTAAEAAHTRALEAKLTVQERADVASRLRIATIQQMLTVQQQQYLSTLGLTTSSKGYEAAAMQILTAEQKQVLSKLDLSSKSAIYRAAIEQEINSKKRNTNATLEGIRAEVKASYARMENAKQAAVTAIQRAEMARYELYWAKQSGDAARIATAEKKLEGAVENQALARKAALATASDFHAKKKNLDTAATAASTAATAADNVAKKAATVSTNIFSIATNRLSIAMKTLWASMKTNPVGWILTLVGLAISAFTLFRKKTDELNDATGEFNETTRKEVDNLNMLVSVLKHTESGTKAHKSALEKVNSVLKEYNKELLDESATVEDLNQKYAELTDAINASAAARVRAKYIEQYQQEHSTNVTDATSKLRKEAGSLRAYEYDSNTDTGYWRRVHSIRKMNKAIFDMIELEAVESADTLKELTGDAYTEAFKATLDRIAAQVQSASGANDRDMQVFTHNISRYLNTIVEDAKALDNNINVLNSSMDGFIAKGGVPESAKSVDYLSMSLSELDKIVNDTNKEIDEINKKTVKVDTDNKRLNELMNLLSQLKGVVSDKEMNLNTEAGLEARIKQLKEERSEVEINSKKYTELTNTINSLEKKLPSKTGKSADIDAQLTEKQIQSQLRLEQAKIEIMEEGHEKRKALLDLQHKQNLLAIDKEERELVKARRDAGKGGLTTDEKDTFQGRRDAESKAYLRAQNHVFDTEINYMKEQYQLYWRWVDNMGKDVANQRFSKLLQSGESYKAYLETQLSSLKTKQQAGTLTEGESNFLISVGSELDEINGVKSAMDLFKESMSNAISEATTLAEKIRVVAEYKERLESGASGIVNADQKAEASLFVSEQEKSNDKEVRERLLNDFKTFEERKTAIVSEFGLLRMQKQVQLNQELLDKVNKGEADALSAINAEMLMQSADWQNLFTNLDYLSAGEIDRIITNIEAQLADGNLNLSPVDYKALMESLNEARAKIIELNPFKALGVSFREYIKNLSALREAQQKNLTDQDLKKFEIAVKNTAKQVANAINEINSIVSTVGDSLAGLSDSFGKEELSTDIADITGLFGSAAQAGTGVAKIISGDIVGGVKDLTTGLANAVQIFNRMHDKKKEREIQSLQKNIDSLTKSYKALGDEIDRAYGVDKADLIEAQNKSLEEMNRQIERQMQAEESKKKTDKQKIEDWQEQIEENEREIAENRKYRIIESIMGTDIQNAIDQFADAYAEAWAKGEKAAGKSADVVKDLIRKSIIETLKGKLQPEVEAFMKYISESLVDGVIDESEQKMIDDWEKRLEAMADRELSGKEKWLRDDDALDRLDDPLRGAIRSMSEETGGIVAGRLNAMVINQSESNRTLSESLLYHKQIAENTRISALELREIKDTLVGIKNKDSSLLSQGIE